MQVTLEIQAWQATNGKGGVGLARTSIAAAGERPNSQACVCAKLLITKRPSSFSSFQHAKGRGTHTDSSANKAGLYVVRISLGTLSDVPAILHVQTQRCVQHI